MDKEVRSDFFDDSVTAPNGYSVDQNKLISKIYAFFSDSINVYKNWGFYLFDEKFDDEPELRNRIGIIILASLFDLLASEKNLREYEKEYDASGLIFLKRYIGQIEEYLEAVKAFLSHYSKEEQIMITYLRNQSVHSFLDGCHKQTMGIKYVVNNIFYQDKIPIDEFHAIAGRFFEEFDLDKLQASFLDKWLSVGYKYSSIVTEFIHNQSIIQDSIYHGRQVQFKYLSI